MLPRSPLRLHGFPTERASCLCAGLPIGNIGLRTVAHCESSSNSKKQAYLTVLTLMNETARRKVTSFCLGLGI